MLGTTEIESKHPKVTIGVSAAFVLSVLIMGGRFFYDLGEQSQRLSVAEQGLIEVQRDARKYLTRDEYIAGNDAIIRELDRMNRNIEAGALERSNAQRPQQRQ